MQHPVQENPLIQILQKTLTKSFLYLLMAIIVKLISLLLLVDINLFKILLNEVFKCNPLLNVWNSLFWKRWQFQLFQNQSWPAWQSSTQDKGFAKQAVDGNRDGDFLKQSCSLTEVDEVPWWGVNLKTETQVVRVAITNRGGSYGNSKNWNLCQHLFNQQSVLS